MCLWFSPSHLRRIPPVGNSPFRRRTAALRPRRQSGADNEEMDCSPFIGTSRQRPRSQGSGGCHDQGGLQSIISIQTEIDRISSFSASTMSS